MWSMNLSEKRTCRRACVETLACSVSLSCGRDTCVSAPIEASRRRRARVADGWLGGGRSRKEASGDEMADEGTD